MRIDYSHNLTINVLYPSLSIFLDIKMKTVSALLAYSTRLWFAIYLLASTLPRLITPARHFHSCNSCCHGREKLAIFMHPFPRVHFHEVLAGYALGYAIGCDENSTVCYIAMFSEGVHYVH